MQRQHSAVETDTIQNCFGMKAFQPADNGRFDSVPPDLSSTEPYGYLTSAVRFRDIERVYKARGLVDRYPAHLSHRICSPVQRYDYKVGYFYV